MRKLVLTAALLAGLVSTAAAHAFLQSAVPAVGGTARAVSTLRLTFTEALEPVFASVSVDLANGTAVAGAKLVHDPQDPKVLIVHLARPLPPGKYKVLWRVVSVDTHHTEGDYTFTVAP